MKVEIKNRYTGRIILRGVYESIADCLSKNSNADLHSANLHSADLFRHTSNLGKLSDKLTLELMRWDAQICGVKEMTRRAQGGSCPFTNIPYKRLFYFDQNRKLWKPGNPKMTLRQVYEAINKELKIKV